MGSVMDYEKCQDCGGVLFVDYYWKTGEESSFCHRCGFSLKSTRLYDERGYAKEDENGHWMYDVEKHKGFGVYGLFTKDVGGSIGCFHEPVTKETIEDFRKIFEDNKGLSEEHSYVAKWEDGKQTLLLGNGLQDVNTMDYEVLMKKWQEEAELAHKNVKPEEYTKEYATMVHAVGLQYLTKDELSETINDYLREKLNFVGDDFKITLVAIVGSRLKGTHREDSDLDIAFEYEGRYRSDSLCDTLNMDPLVIDDIRVDFLPYARYKGEKIDFREAHQHIWATIPFKEEDLLPF